jgi:putative ABC transport system ATP-binding protein
LIKLECVSKEYNHRGRAVTALDEATFEIAQGDFVSIVGPSGSGKSTLLLVLGGMLSPSSGRVFLDGRSLYDLTQDERARLRKARIGFVFQTFNLVPYLSALENVQIPLFLVGMDESHQTTRAAALLERVGLSDRLSHKPSELSVGEQQRVALARVLANDPEVVLADEPTGNLDPETGQHVLDFLCQINEEGKTVVMVTHDPGAAEIAGTTLRLNQGTLVSLS